ncbi:MAG TPA: RidA family protein [Gemmatimonadales bacterium]|nr:RidA family protein [Gemmatimonadales bacterium]
MRRAIFFSFLTAAQLLIPCTAFAQYRGMGGPPTYRPPVPKLPGSEIAGPLDTGMARTLLKLSDSQATRYDQAYDSFMVATRPQRDSANAAVQKMNDLLDTGDRPAAMYYVDQVNDLGKFLRDRQERWENDLKKFLSGDQMNQYKKWKDGEDQRKRRQDEVRWTEAAFRGDNAPIGGGRGAAPEIKTALPLTPGIAAPAIGSQAVIVGRTLYAAAQLGVDSAGALAGADLRAQAERAFANLTAVLQAGGSSPRSVTTLTIAVVNYKAADLATIRDAGPTYFGANAPIVTVVGVESVGRDGALISIGAIAIVTGTPRATAPK